MNLLNSLQEKHKLGKKSIAVLIDPDKVEDSAKLHYLINLASENCVDYFFVGGSLITTTHLSDVVKHIKKNVNIPVILFPGNSLQIESTADAILFLSLISGRNPEFLIGQHVVAAPILKNTRLEVIPTGYILTARERLSLSYLAPGPKPNSAGSSFRMPTRSIFSSGL